MRLDDCNPSLRQRIEAQIKADSLISVPRETVKAIPQPECGCDICESERAAKATEALLASLSLVDADTNRGAVDILL